MGTLSMKTRIICVRVGDLYDHWWEDNLRHMIDTYSGIEYDEFVCIRDEEFEMPVANKLLMFDRYRDGQNLYFDLDVLIKGDCNQFFTQDLHVCLAWWREAWHTPLNSSIISWQGDKSDIYDEFASDPEYYMLKYNKGIDQYLYEIKNPSVFTEGFCSYQTVTSEENYNVYLFNQRMEFLRSTLWCQKYLLQYQ